MDNIKCDSASNASTCQLNNGVSQVFDSLTTSFWTMDTVVYWTFRGIWC